MPEVTCVKEITDMLKVLRDQAQADFNTCRRLGESGVEFSNRYRIITEIFMLIEGMSLSSEDFEPVGVNGREFMVPMAVAAEISRLRAMEGLCEKAYCAADHAAKLVRSVASTALMGV